MWPTFPTAYRFSTKMELHISISSPRAFQVTVCISWRGETEHFVCMHSCVRRHWNQRVSLQVLRLWHFYVIPISRGTYASTQSSSQGSLVPRWSWNCQHIAPPTIYPVIRRRSKHNVSSGCFDAICLHIEMRGKQTIRTLGMALKQIERWRRENVRERWTHTLSLEWNSERRKCNPSPCPLCSPHTWLRPVPTLSQSDTDGANMRDVSGVARERYLLARWKPNAVNYTACLPNHFSPREMAGQDKLVISQKQSIWKDDVLSAVRNHLPALWNGIMAGK